MGGARLESLFVTLAYGVCVGSSSKFERLALSGISAVDPEAPILVRYDQRSIFEAYNSIIDEAATLDTEGLVFIHDDVLIRDINFATKMTALFEDPTIGIVGVVGASNLKNIEWWWFDTHGGVEENGRRIDFGVGTFDVDVVDGLLIAMSPTALRTLRFDETNFSGFHGYDVDIGMQAKSAGLRVVVADFDVFHDSVPGRVTNRAAHLKAGYVWRRKWRRTASQRIDYLVFLWGVRKLGMRHWIPRLMGPAGPKAEVLLHAVGKLRGMRPKVKED